MPLASATAQSDLSSVQGSNILMNFTGNCLPTTLVQLYRHSIYIRELTNVLDTRLMVRTCPDGPSVAPNAALIFSTARFHGGLGPFLTTRYGRASQNFRMEARA
jgi:hypothetical protein